MSIWFLNLSLAELNRKAQNNMCGHLAMEFIDIGPEHLSARMPVDERTTQPAGLLHGGASVALAETLGSFAAYLCVDPQSKACVGQEINANHLRAVRSGWVTGTARPLHLGARSQVWDIRIHNETGALVCVSRLTVAVVDKKLKS
jgi:1,4-dihydroxy-2-naphthoyl-CoA hydrolase